jgi:DNA-binding response OmpR family regulator
MTQQRRILIVEDEPSIVKMVSKRLEASGFGVSVAMDGEDGLIRARTERPDLIVLDLMLPKMSGLKVCAALKQDPNFHQIPIIIFTGKDQVVDQETCRKSGADAYIPKALGATVLLTEINALLNKTPRPGGS